MQTPPGVRRRKPLRERSSLTFGDIERQPDALVGCADLAAAGIVGSYSTIDRWVREGKLDPPIRLPSGQKKWRGSTILRMLGLTPEKLDDEGTGQEAA